MNLPDMIGLFRLRAVVKSALIILSRALVSKFSCTRA
jgi:hypothetical protein